MSDKRLGEKRIEITTGRVGRKRQAQKRVRGTSDIEIARVAPSGGVEGRCGWADQWEGRGVWIEEERRGKERRGRALSLKRTRNGSKKHCRVQGTGSSRIARAESMDNGGNAEEKPPRVSGGFQRPGVCMCTLFARGVSLPATGGYKTVACACRYCLEGRSFSACSSLSGLLAWYEEKNASGRVWVGQQTEDRLRDYGVQRTDVRRKGGGGGH